MNVIKKRTARAFILLSVCGVLITLGFNCSGFKVSGSAGESSSSSNIGSDLAGGPLEPNLVFMTAEQMLKAMLAVTGTEGLGDLSDPADANIAQVYAARSGALPSQNSLTQATGPTLIAVTNLAASVCEKAVLRDIAIPEVSRDTRLFFQEFDFSKGLGAQSSEAVSSAFSRLARNSWRRDATSEELQMIQSFTAEFSQAANLTDTAQTRLLAVSVCTAVLSSIDGLTY